MQRSISHYIKEQSCATLCCVDEEGHPYCFNCFYTFNEEQQLLYFKSNEDSLHSGLLRTHPAVAGTILPDKLNKLMTQGVQFLGKALEPGELLSHNAHSIFHHHHPMALAKAGHVWTIQLNIVKMTEHALGFGKKVTWEREKVAT